MPLDCWKSLDCWKTRIKGGPTLPALFTKAPSSSYKLSDKHDVYVKDLHQIPESLPPPWPPRRKKTELIDISEYLLVDDRAIRVPLTILSKPIEALVEYLIQGYEDEMSKVRVLYRWLTNQPIHRMQVLEHRPKNSASALYHLWQLRLKRERYSKLFSTMCRYAGLYCVIVHGAVKGIHYQIGDRIDMDKHYGEWNAVNIEGEWRFIDALWGTCDVKDKGDGRGHFTCDERFFLTDPKDLIYTHFAVSDRWQLLDSPRHLESFEQTACLKNRFFELGMQVLSHPICEVEAPDGELEVLFGLQPKQGHEQKFNCYISHFDRPETKRYMSRGSNTSVPVFIHRLTDSSVAIRVRFPESGIYRLEIVGKHLGKTSLYKEYDWIAVYKVITECPADRGFPKMDPIGWGPGPEMQKIGLAPFNYTSGLIVAKNVQTKVRFKILDTALVQNMKFFFKMASTYDNDYNVNSVCDRFEIDTNIMTFFIDAPPFGEYTLKMYAKNVRGNVPRTQRKEINICNYLLISDIQQRDTPLGVLTEKTEFFDDSPNPTPRQRAEYPTERKNEPAESVVSASNVVMDSNSHKADSVAPSPEPADEVPPPPVNTPMTSPRTEPQAVNKEPPSQSFVHVDGNIQEIPTIPLDVVQPVEPETHTARPTEKREMKVVSTNKVVPLKGAGGDDESIMLVPADKQQSRPKTGLQRTRSRDDTKFFTALAHVRGDKK